MLFLNVQCAGERDVAVEMALVKFIEDDGGNSFERGVGDELAEQNAFGLEFDFRRRADAILEAHLIADFAAKLHAEFLRDA